METYIKDLIVNLYNKYEKNNPEYQQYKLHKSYLKK